GHHLSRERNQVSHGLGGRRRHHLPGRRRLHRCPRRSLSSPGGSVMRRWHTGTLVAVWLCGAATAVAQPTTPSPSSVPSAAPEGSQETAEDSTEETPWSKGVAGTQKETA